MKKGIAEKIKNSKIVQWTKKKCGAVHAFFLKSFEETYYGSVLVSFLVSVVLFSVPIKSLLLGVPLILCIPAAALATVLCCEILCLIIRLIFGRKKRNRVYWLFMFCSLVLCGLIGGQMRQPALCLLFGFVSAFSAGLAGRCLWALIKHKRHTPFVIVCTVISAVGLTAFLIFLGGEGYQKSYVGDYLSEAEKHPKTETGSLSFRPDESGEYEAAFFTYGTEEENDLVSENLDLSKYAKQNFIDKFNRKIVLGCGLSDAPLAGKIWYPKGEKNCPVLFIIHGNHSYNAPSYLGYDYLGEYLATYGYVVISVDENVCNDLNNENDARAVLLLENIKYILEQNRNEACAIYQLIDEERIALAGHSRGGEAVSTAYLFNGYDSYPENGNIKFDYHFLITSLIAIAPCVDQYVPAGHEVALKDVNYLIIHGAKDQDVSTAMGQKQYHNISFTGEKECIKTMLYVSAANHGQFNSVWGKYDMIFPVNQFLNVADLMPEEKQHDILKIFAKTFLDVTVKQDHTDERLLTDYRYYEKDLPQTVYQQIYQTSDFISLADFEEDSDLNTATVPKGRIKTSHLCEWTEEKTVFGLKNTRENYALKIKWKETKEAELRLSMPEQTVTGKAIVFDVADVTEEKNSKILDGTVILEDADGNQAEVRISNETVVYPSLPVRLEKIDYLFGTYDYKHQFQTVTIPADDFLEKNKELDPERIVKITLRFDGSEKGDLLLDNIGLE